MQKLPSENIGVGTAPSVLFLSKKCSHAKCLSIPAAIEHTLEQNSRVHGDIAFLGEQEHF
jgi:hypothetical protein